MFEGVRRGSGLTKKAWAVIRSDPGLAKLPLTGGALALAAFVVLGVPGALLVDGDSTGAVIGGSVLLAMAAYSATFTVFLFNVTLAAAADQAMRGSEPDLAAARGVARSRVRKIAAWALVSVGVSVVLNVLRKRGGRAGHFAADVGADIWRLVTFLVVPVLAFEGIGPFPALKRSAVLSRQRWGEQVTGTLVIGGVSGLIVVAGIVFVAGGVVVLVDGGAGAAVVGGGLLILVGAAVAVGGATRGVFGVALYRYVVEDRTVGPFTTADLNAAVRTQ